MNEDIEINFMDNDSGNDSDKPKGRKFFNRNKFPANKKK